MNHPQKLADTAEAAARRAGELLRRKWTEPRQLAAKGFRDIVTDSDYASQSIISKTILERYPDHGFLAEEDDSDLPESGPVIWIVDPIDGTTNFSRAIPEFCISIGAAIDGEVVAGVIYDVLRDELFRAGAGYGAFLNGQQIRVSQPADRETAIWAVDIARDFTQRRRILASLQKHGQEVRSLRAIGAAALALAWLAAGRIDLYLHYTLSAWDVAAGAVLINEAGGQLSCADGQAWTLANSEQGIFASNGHQHEETRQKVYVA